MPFIAAVGNQQPTESRHYIPEVRGPWQGRGWCLCARLTRMRATDVTIRTKRWLLVGNTARDTMKAPTTLVLEMERSFIIHQ
jgi:hypothetical protein